MSRFCATISVLFLLVAMAVQPAGSQPGRVVDTVHNLSVSGPGEIHSLTERQVCKFCHLPHNTGSPAPLWGHALSKEQYQVPKISTGGQDRHPTPQPDGSSRLCLSCHDGTIALGDILGEPRPISMTTQSVLRPGRAGFLGTDLSGSHPISFVVADVPPEGSDRSSDFRLRPIAEIRADGDIRLDGAGKMQCTTCHDPHADENYVPGQVPRFWVRPTVNEVCLHCHAPS